MTPPDLAPVATLGRRIEDGLNVIALIAMGVLPVLELLFRACCNSGIRGSSNYVQHLTQLSS